MLIKVLLYQGGGGGVRDIRKLKESESSGVALLTCMLAMFP